MSVCLSPIGWPSYSRQAGADRHRRIGRGCIVEQLIFGGPFVEPTVSNIAAIRQLCDGYTRRLPLLVGVCSQWRLVRREFRLPVRSGANNFGSFIDSVRADAIHQQLATDSAPMCRSVLTRSVQL